MLFLLDWKTIFSVNVKELIDFILLLSTTIYSVSTRYSNKRAWLSLIPGLSYVGVYSDLIGGEM